MASIKDEVVVNLIGELPLLSSIVLDGLKEPAHLFLGYTLRAYSYVISVLPLGTQSETEARKPTFEHLTQTILHREGQVLILRMP